MKWEDYRQSEHVEDRRADGGGGLGGMIGGGGGRGGLGLGTIVVLGLLGWALGINPGLLIGGAEMLNGMRGGGATVSQPKAGPPADDMGRFISAVLAQNEDVWQQLLPQQLGAQYKPPGLVVFSGVTRSACGTAQSAMGPFYCPMDRKVYLDTAFFQDMQRKLGGGGDFAYAYVIGHEVGHHIQNVIGILPKVTQVRQRVSERESNALSVRTELQADCFAGVWANALQAQNRLDQGDIEEAMRTASAIGDDKLQKAAQGYAVPDSFTHGSADQRMRWFMTGFRSGNLRACDTFNGNAGV